MKLLFLASLSQSLGKVADPLEYWTRGQDDSSYPSLHRGPTGTNKISELGTTYWDRMHMYNLNGPLSSETWSWLQPPSVAFDPGEEPTGSNFYIFTYLYSGINGLHEENSAGKLLSL